MPECPTEAIFFESGLPRKWRKYAELNARLSREWPNITATMDPLPDAEEWKDVEKKRKHLSESPAT